MSLDPKSVHVRLTPEMYERLIVLAGLDSRDVAAHAAMLLEKMIVADWHAVTLQLDRLKRLGLTGMGRE
jgi:predicted DNA-binding protein